MIRRAILCALVAAGLGAPAAALADAKLELLEMAAQGAESCRIGMPDARATSAALKERGFVTAEANGFMKAFTDKTRKAVVLITTADNKRSGCVVSASGLSVEQAGALIQPWIAATNAQRLPGSDRKFAAGWRGTFKGGPVELLIARPANLVTFRGAAIIARQPVGTR